MEEAKQEQKNLEEKNNISLEQIRNLNNKLAQEKEKNQLENGRANELLNFLDVNKEQQIKLEEMNT